MAGMGYGLPLKCPQCPTASYYGQLKVPGNKANPCPNCGTHLVPAHPRKKGASRGRVA